MVLTLCVFEVKAKEISGESLFTSDDRGLMGELKMSSLEPHIPDIVYI